MTGEETGLWPGAACKATQRPGQARCAGALKASLRLPAGMNAGQFHRLRVVRRAIDD